jgi:hypothetical protein
MKSSCQSPVLAIGLGLLMLIVLPACGVQQLARGNSRLPRSPFKVSRSTSPMPGAGPWAPGCIWRTPTPSHSTSWGMITSCGSKADPWPKEPANNRSISRPWGKRWRKSPSSCNSRRSWSCCPGSCPSNNSSPSSTIKSPAASASLPSWEGLSLFPSGSRGRLPLGKAWTCSAPTCADSGWECHNDAT